MKHNNPKVYAPNKSHVIHKKTKLKGKIEKSTIIVEDSNIPLSN